MKKLATVGSFGAKIAIVITATVGGTALIGSSVFASLTATATNTGGQSVTTGTLSYAQSNVPILTAGLTTAVTGVVPGDVINRFINLTNGGTLAASTISLKLAEAATLPVVTTSSPLTSTALTGLQVAVFECSVAYNTSTGNCGGTETPVITATTANALVSIAAPVTLVSTAGGATSRLKFVITLPAGNEVIANGVIPASSVTGITSALTWTFTAAPRSANNNVA